MPVSLDYIEYKLGKSCVVIGLWTDETHLYSNIKRSLDNSSFTPDVLVCPVKTIGYFGGSSWTSTFQPQPITKTKKWERKLRSWESVNLVSQNAVNCMHQIKTKLSYSCVCMMIFLVYVKYTLLVRMLSKLWINILWKNIVCGYS